MKRSVVLLGIMAIVTNGTTAEDENWRIPPDKEDFHITPKIDGWLCAIHYKQTGGHSAEGKKLKEIWNTNGIKELKEKRFLNLYGIKLLKEI